MSLSPSAETLADPFSDILASLGVRMVRGTGLQASGDWALAFDGRERLKFVAVVKGHCWLLVEGDVPLLISAGDVVLICDTRYVVASDPAIAPIEGMPLYALPSHDLVRLGEGNQVAMIGGGCGFAAGSSAFVLDALPKVLRVDPTLPEAEAVTRMLRYLIAEVARAELGSSLVVERLAEILIISAVRAYVASSPETDIGWITALSDARIGKALRLLHGDVARRWTVPALASEIGMSRSSFTQHFVDRVGRPPLDYLTHWRMVLADRKLNSGQPVASVAADIGYSSQSAFSHAFKRTFGRTPRSTV